MNGNPVSYADPTGQFLIPLVNIAGKLEGPVANYLGPMNTGGLAKQFAGAIGALAGFGANSILPGSQGGFKP